MANDLILLQKLCNSYGISGDEASVRDVILAEISPFATDINVDNLGNIIAFKRGARRPAKKLMLSAHMDEVGFIVTHITDDGLLKFSAVGGIDANVTCGKRVVVGSKKVPGVIGVKPVHLLNADERQRSIPLDELYIDIGAASKEAALKCVSPGDSVCFPANFRFERNMVKSKAIDDRVGCFILINLLKQDLPFDMHFTFVVQEEIGLRGAKVAAFAVSPDVALVVEATTAADIKGTPAEKQVCKLGGGAVIAFMDKSTIYDKALYERALALAREHDIKVQVKSLVAGGNDAGAIHTSREGVKTLAISLPCRYLHTACGMICADDIWATQELVHRLAECICGGLK